MPNVLTAESLRNLGGELTATLDRYGLRGEERVCALLSAAYGEAGQCGLSRNQLNDRTRLVYDACHDAGMMVRAGNGGG